MPEGGMYTEMGVKEVTGMFSPASTVIAPITPFPVLKTDTAQVYNKGNGDASHPNNKNSLVTIFTVTCRLTSAT